MSAPPARPASHAALHAALPARCLRPSTARSLLHLAIDLSLLAAVVALSLRLEGWGWVLPLAIVEGTLLWALFVIGHDCGHGSFSRHGWLNAWVGHLVHTPLLVPYHAWRLSHAIHHRHAGDLDRDEGWFPLTEAQRAALPAVVRWLRGPLLFLVFPLYLLRRSPARAGSHYDPGDPMFPDAERHRVRRSVRACGAFVLLLVAAALWLGPLVVLRAWALPWLVASAWVSVVTFLHHTDPAVPWYRGAGWSWLEGALSATDRSYGWLEPIHHHAGCHVVHHLFPGVPHYRLREASRSLRPLLGPRYRVPQEPVLRALGRAVRGCPIVPEQGERVYARPPGPGGRARATSGAGSSPATT